MIKSFNEILPAIKSKALCSVGVSLKTKAMLSVKITASGFAAITDTNMLVVYTVIPIKSAAIFDINSLKKLTVKNHFADQKIVEGKFLNLYTKEYDDLILQIAPRIEAFPNQESNLERFLSILEAHSTE